MQRPDLAPDDGPGRAEVGATAEERLGHLIETLRRAPGQLVRATRGLGRAAITWKPSPKEFSILENVAHLHDIEQEGYLVRVRRLLQEDRPFLPDIDGERLAIERRYNTRDLESELRAFAAARRETLHVLQRVPPSLLARQGDLDQVGVVTLERLLGMQVDHDRGHIREIERLRGGTGPPAVE